MSIKITFPGNKKVDALINGYTIHTDQRISDGGDGTAPAPFELFLASIGTCAGIYVLGFCESRGISTEGIEIEQRPIYDPILRRITKIELEIKVPEGFPERYKDALINVANLCAVKKALENPPTFDTYVTEKSIEKVLNY